MTISKHLKDLLLFLKPCLTVVGVLIALRLEENPGLEENSKLEENLRLEGNPRHHQSVYRV